MFDSTRMSLGVGYGAAGGSMGSHCINYSHQAVFGPSLVCVAH